MDYSRDRSNHDWDTEEEDVFHNIPQVSRQTVVKFRFAGPLIVDRSSICNAGAAPQHLFLATTHAGQDHIDSIIETALGLDRRRIALGSLSLSEICGHVLGLGCFQIVMKGNGSKI